MAPLRSGSPHAFIRLEPDDAAAVSARADYTDVLGDRDFSSSRQSMQRLNPHVYEVVVSFEPMTRSARDESAQPAGDFRD